jgi:hypothetical protein
MHCTSQPVLITNISDEPAKSRVIAKALACFILLQFVAGKYDDFLGVEVRKRVLDKSFAKRACATGDEDR